MSHPNHSRPNRKKSPPPAKPPEHPLGIDKKRLYLLVFSVVILFTVYGYFRDTQPQVAGANEPKLPSLWHQVLENDAITVSVDVANFNLQSATLAGDSLEQSGLESPTTTQSVTNKVDFWERVEFKAGFAVPEEVNADLLFKFDEPLESMLSHFMVDCEQQTYQRLSSSYTQIDGKQRFMRTDEAPSAPAPIEANSLLNSSAAYACDIKDMPIKERLSQLS